MPPKKNPNQTLNGDQDTNLLLKLVEKITLLVDRNLSLTDEIKHLREEQKQFMEIQRDLLKRIEDLENGHQDWARVGRNATTTPDPDDIK